MILIKNILKVSPICIHDSMSFKVVIIILVGFIFTPSFYGQNDNEKIYSIADVMPQFIGGQESLSQFIANNIHYPEDAKKEDVKGKVYVSFVVGKDGVLKDIEVLKKLHTLLDEEAIRVVKLMPNWEPGIKDGKKVDVRFHLPIIFE